MFRLLKDQKRQSLQELEKDLIFRHEKLER